MRLNNKIAIITGGASGIGLACADLFIQQGAKVMIADMNEAALKNALNEINSPNLDYSVTDVTNAKANQEMAQKCIERFGGIDIFIANAGIEGDQSPILEIEEENFDLVMSVNVKGPMFGVRAVAQSMIERGGGSVVITSSIAATRGGLLAYTTSKHAVTGLMRSMAKQLAQYNIRVNSVNPGPVRTPMIERLDQKIKDALFAKLPLGRFAESYEIANVILFLASDESSWVTGQFHLADGGESV